MNVTELINSIQSKDIRAVLGITDDTTLPYCTLIPLYDEKTNGDFGKNYFKFILFQLNLNTKGMKEETEAIIENILEENNVIIEDAVYLVKDNGDSTKITKSYRFKLFNQKNEEDKEYESNTSTINI